MLRSGEEKKIAEFIDAWSNRLIQEHVCLNFAVRHIYYLLDQQVVRFEKNFGEMQQSPDYIDHSSSIVELRD